MRKLTCRNNGAVTSLQFNVKFETTHCARQKYFSEMELKEINNKTFLRSIVWQYNKITCFMFGHKIPVNIFFIVAEMPSQSVRPG